MSSFRDENVRYLWPLWLRVGLIYAASVVIVAYVLWSWRGDLAVAWPIAGGVGVGVTVAMWKRHRLRGRSNDALQLASADAAARLLFGVYLDQPGKAIVPLVLTGTAQVHVVYGNFARAVEMLEAYDWSKEPPLIRGDKLFVLALMEHVKGNHEAGFAHATTMMPMMDLPRLFPGSARLRRSLDFLQYLGRALAHGDSEAMARLADPKLTRSSRLQRGVAAWVLATIEEQRGHSDEARRWLTESRAILPRTLTASVSSDRQAPPTVTHDPNNPYAAPSAAAVDATPFEARRGQGSFWRRHRLKFVGVWLVVLLGAHTYLSCIDHHG